MFIFNDTYTDFNGTERTEEFRFNLSEAEVTEMELTKEGGMKEFLLRILNSKDQTQMVAVFKQIVLKAYGEKSEDGRRFVKSPEITKAFEETPAYSDLFMKLVTDDEFAAKFINKTLPDMDKFAKKIDAAPDNKSNKTK